MLYGGTTEGAYCTAEVGLTAGLMTYGDYECQITCSKLPSIPCEDTSYCTIFGGDYCCA